MRIRTRCNRQREQFGADFVKERAIHEKKASELAEALQRQTDQLFRLNSINFQVPMKFLMQQMWQRYVSSAAIRKLLVPFADPSGARSPEGAVREAGEGPVGD